MMWCMFQLLSKGIVFRSGSQTVSPSTQNGLSITVDSVLAQKLAPNARIVVWYITARGEIVSDSLDFTVNGAFANEVNCILNAVSSSYLLQSDNRQTVREIRVMAQKVFLYNVSFVLNLLFHTHLFSSHPGEPGLASFPIDSVFPHILYCLILSFSDVSTQSNLLSPTLTLDSAARRLQVGLQPCQSF